MTEKQEPYVIELGGQEYLVVPGLASHREGRVVEDVDLDPQGDPHRKILTEDELAELVPDPGAREWLRTTRPTRTFYKGVRPEGEHNLCANDRCVNLVPPSKNPGVARIFCRRQCALRYHSRMYAKRNTYGVGALERDRTTGEQHQFNRSRPDTLKKALERYRAHIQSPTKEGKPICPNATEETRWRCPAHMMGDYYSAEKRCLIYAVLVDDMKERAARERGEFYYRQWTTADGRWALTGLEDPDTAIHLRPMVERSRDLARMERLVAQIGGTELQKEAQEGIADDDLYPSI